MPAVGLNPGIHRSLLDQAVAQLSLCFQLSHVGRPAGKLVHSMPADVPQSGLSGMSLLSVVTTYAPLWAKARNELLHVSMDRVSPSSI